MTGKPGEEPFGTPPLPLDVAGLPRRVAHVTHALLAASAQHRMPVTAGEVVIYDAEALDARATGRALARARSFGLAVNHGRLWVATGLALSNVRALEDRYLAEVQL